MHRLLTAVLNNSRVRYCFVKAFSVENLHVSQTTNSWYILPNFEKTVESALGHCGMIVLLLTVNGSSYLHGIAVMKSMSTLKGASGTFYNDLGRPVVGKIIEIEWLYKQLVPLCILDDYGDKEQSLINQRNFREIDTKFGHRILQHYIKENPTGCIPKLSWKDDVLVANPCLALYPADLTKMSFQGYEALYELSERYYEDVNDVLSGYAVWNTNPLEEEAIANEFRRIISTPGARM